MSVELFRLRIFKRIPWILQECSKYDYIYIYIYIFKSKNMYKK